MINPEISIHKLRAKQVTIASLNWVSLTTATSTRLSFLVFSRGMRVLFGQWDDTDQRVNLSKIINFSAQFKVTRS